MNKRKAKKHYVVKYSFKKYKDIKQIPYCDMNIGQNKRKERKQR